MSEHELDHLLGGFAANTLTDDEKRRLYAAALYDQQLFNALADEQALRELLADPAVRRRLLEALHSTGSSTAGATRSWLDWFRRPAHLALAGGLTAAVFAVVFGTRVYQESLRQAAQAVATEDVRPMAPPASSAVKSQPSPPSSAERMHNADKEEARAEPESSAQLRKPSDGLTIEDTVRRKQDEVPRQATQPVTALLDKTRKKAAPSTEQDLSTASAPPASKPAPAPLPAPSSEAAKESVRSMLNARALYYGESTRRDAELMTKQKERTTEPFGASARKFERLEQKEGQPEAVSEMANVPLKPLGLRYSFVTQSADGREREIDKATAAKSTRPIFLTVEVNQESYLQIWKFGEPPTPELVFPKKDAGTISYKMTAGRRERIPMPTSIDTLTIRVSRTPFGPIIRQEAMLLDQSTSQQLQESVSPSKTADRSEQAQYVVNPDLSPTMGLSATISLDR